LDESGHPACKKLGVGLSMVMICSSSSSRFVERITQCL